MKSFLRNLTMKFGKPNEVVRQSQFRTLYNKTAYRLFAFWDETEKSMIIVTHGIIKKTGKTPKKEIEKAKQLRTEYLKIIKK